MRTSGEAEEGMPERTSEKEKDLEVVLCLAEPGCLWSPCGEGGARQG